MLYNLQRAAYILARCPTTCLHSHPSIIIIIIITRTTPRELFDEREKICGTKVHVHDMYIRYRLYWGRLLIYPHVPRYVQYMSIHRYLRIIGPVIIMRSPLTGTSTGYSIHHATSIAMTSYLLALASIPYIGRCHSALEGRISLYMY